MENAKLQVFFEEATFKVQTVYFFNLHIYFNSLDEIYKNTSGHVDDSTNNVSI